MNNKLSNVFKVVLHSASATVVNNEYTWRVNLADVQGKVLRCGVQSIISNGVIVNSTPYNIHLRPLVQMRSWEARTQTPTDILFTGRTGVQDYIFPVNSSDVNFEVAGDVIRGMNSLTVYFTDINFARQAAANVFQIVIWFYEAK